MKIFSCVLLIPFTITFSAAQDLSYAHAVIDTLASPAMHGRGYVQGGDKLASAFVAGEFRKFDLVPLAGNFFQEISFPVNTFPGEMNLEIDGLALAPGKDFIVSSCSGSLSGTFNIERLGHILETPLQKRENFIIVIDSGQFKDSAFAGKENLCAENLMKNFALKGIHPSGIILLEEEKLTASVSVSRSSVALIVMRSKALPPAAREAKINIRSVFHKKYRSRNVAGMIRGIARPDSFIVFTAHYDHLGRMGDSVFFPGANDNASGIAMLLNLAGYFSAPEHRPYCSIAFIAFGGEELGLLGSEYYTEHPLFPLSQIKFLINMDLLGTGEEGMMVVNGSVYEEAFRALLKVNEEHRYLPQILKRPRAMNSDHYYFTEKGVPSFFFYTLGGIRAYHDIYDRPETLPLTEFEDIFRLVVAFTEISLQGEVPGRGDSYPFKQ